MYPYCKQEYKIAPICAGELNTKVKKKTKLLSCTKIKIGQVKRMGTKLETEPSPVEQSSQFKTCFKSLLYFTSFTVSHIREPASVSQGEVILPMYENSEVY